MNQAEWEQKVKELIKRASALPTPEHLGPKRLIELEALIEKMEELYK